jgi:hypothetical protein
MHVIGHEDVGVNSDAVPGRGSGKTRDVLGKVCRLDKAALAVVAALDNVLGKTDQR